METSRDRKGMQLDPRTKLFVMLTIVIYVVGGVALPKWVIIGIGSFPLFLMCMDRQIKKTMLYAAIFLLAEGYLELIAIKIPEAFSVVLTMCCVIITRMLPGIIMGSYMLSSTKVSEFIAAMERMHITRKLSIPLSVMFRFFPTVMEEFHAINCAMRMRDIRIFGKHFSKAVEYRVIPLLVCSVKIGDELSAAALSRGLSPDETRTNICDIGFHIQDVLVLILMLVPTGIAIAS